jgi:hypothetical protein
MAEWSNAPDLNYIQLSGLLGGSGSNPDGEEDSFAFLADFLFYLRLQSALEPVWSTSRVIMLVVWFALRC